MAITVAEANAVSTAVYDKKMVQQAYDEVYFFAKLKKDDKIIQSGGNDIRWPIRYKKLGTADAVDWDDQVTFEKVDTRTSAVLDWAPYRARTLLTWQEDSTNQAGKQRIINLIEDKTKELTEELLDNLATDLFATSSVTGNIIPLSTIIDSADTYGAVTVSDAATWAGIEDSSSTQLTRALLNTSVASAQFGTNGPTVHITTRALLGKYDNLIGAAERWTDTETANMGFNHLSFYMKPVIGDAYQQSTYWYGIDMKAFEMHVLKGEDMNMGGWIDLSPAGYPGSLGKVARHVCNIVCRRRRTSFKLSALTGT